MIYHGMIIRPSFNRYNFKNVKNMLIFLYGVPRLVNVSSTVECTNTLVEIAERANIIYRTKMDSEVDKNVRIALVCGSWLFGLVTDNDSM